MNEKALPKIYLFRDGSGMAGFVYGVALAENGALLTGHLSTDEDWLRHDLGLTSDWKHDHYRRHYPDGYELVWLDNPEADPGCRRAIALHQERAKAEGMSG